MTGSHFNVITRKGKSVPTRHGKGEKCRSGEASLGATLRSFHVASPGLLKGKSSTPSQPPPGTEGRAVFLAGHFAVLGQQRPPLPPYTSSVGSNTDAREQSKIRLNCFFTAAPSWELKRARVTQQFHRPSFSPRAHSPNFPTHSLKRTRGMCREGGVGGLKTAVRGRWVRTQRGRSILGNYSTG